MSREFRESQIMEAVDLTGATTYSLATNFTVASGDRYPEGIYAQRTRRGGRGPYGRKLAVRRAGSTVVTQN